MHDICVKNNRKGPCVCSVAQWNKEFVFECQGLSRSKHVSFMAVITPSGNLRHTGIVVAYILGYALQHSKIVTSMLSLFYDNLKMSQCATNQNCYSGTSCT